MQVKEKLLLGAVLLLAAGAAQAATYEIDPAHSQVSFRIRHLVGKVQGKFTDFSGTVDYDDKKPDALATSVVIKIASVDTSSAKRDEHLKTPDFFNAAAFPEMTFKSTKAVVSTPGKVSLTGDLTLHGVTKPVTLDVEINGVIKDPWGNQRSGFHAAGTLNRKDFGMAYNMPMDSGGLMLGDDVEISIDVEAVQKAAVTPGKDDAKKKKK